jgi:hypothetical protein
VSVTGGRKKEARAKGGCLAKAVGRWRHSDVPRWGEDDLSREMWGVCRYSDFSMKMHHLLLTKACDDEPVMDSTTTSSHCMSITNGMSITNACTHAATAAISPNHLQAAVESRQVGIATTKVLAQDDQIIGYNSQLIQDRIDRCLILR